jgi:hypothetical protein
MLLRSAVAHRPSVGGVFGEGLVGFGGGLIGGLTGMPGALLVRSARDRQE